MPGPRPFRLTVAISFMFCAMASRKACGCSSWPQEATCKYCRQSRRGLVAVSFTPDGNYIMFVRSDKSTVNFRYLYQMPVLGGTPKQLNRDVDSATQLFARWAAVRVCSRRSETFRKPSSHCECGWQRRTRVGAT